MTIENRAIWDAVCKTDPSCTKKVDQRGGFTAIDSYYQIERATEMFGSIGCGWGYDAKDEIIDIGEIKLVKITLVFWYMRDTKRFTVGPILATNSLYDGKKIDEDAFKKATTDAITKALSYLGFSADVFLGKFKDNKYVQERIQEEEEEAKKKQKAGGGSSHEEKSKSLHTNTEGKPDPWLVLSKKITDDLSSSSTIEELQKVYEKYNQDIGTMKKAVPAYVEALRNVYIVNKKTLEKAAINKN